MTLLQANDLPIAYLCGQEPYCMIVGDEAALRQAKRNVEQSFPVVGVLEELSKTHVQTQPNHCVPHVTALITHSHITKLTTSGNCNHYSVFSYSTDTTLAILESELPSFFKGASHLYYKQLKGELITFRGWDAFEM